MTSSTAALKGAAEDQIDAAVAAGKLTKDQGDAAKKRIESSTGVPLGGGFGARRPRPRRPRRPRWPGRRSRRPARVRLRRRQVADGRGDLPRRTDDALRKDLENGQSLADVAKAQNKDTAGLKAAMKTAITTELDQQVKDNKLTADQEKQLESNLDQRLDDLISNTRPKGGPQGLLVRPPASVASSAEGAHTSVTASPDAVTAARPQPPRRGQEPPRARPESQRQRIDEHVRSAPARSTARSDRRPSRRRSPRRRARPSATRPRSRPRRRRRPPARRRASPAAAARRAGTSPDAGSARCCPAGGRGRRGRRASIPARSCTKDCTNVIPLTYGNSSWSWRNFGIAGDPASAEPSRPLEAWPGRLVLAAPRRATAPLRRARPTVVLR